MNKIQCFYSILFFGLKLEVIIVSSKNLSTSVKSLTFIETNGSTEKYDYTSTSIYDTTLENDDDENYGFVYPDDEYDNNNDKTVSQTKINDDYFETATQTENYFTTKNVTMLSSTPVNDIFYNVLSISDDASEITPQIENTSLLSSNVDRATKALFTTENKRNKIIPITTETIQNNSILLTTTNKSLPSGFKNTEVPLTTKNNDFNMTVSDEKFLNISSFSKTINDINQTSSPVTTSVNKTPLTTKKQINIESVTDKSFPNYSSSLQKVNIIKTLSPVNTIVSKANQMHIKMYKYTTEKYDNNNNSNNNNNNSSSNTKTVITKNENHKIINETMNSIKINSSNNTNTFVFGSKVNDSVWTISYIATILYFILSSIFY